MSWEVVVPSRGTVGPVLAGLVPHAADAPFRLRLLVARMPDGDWERGLVEMLSRLGCHVTVELQWQKGHPRARAQAITTSTADVMVFLDDDAVLTPPGCIFSLVQAATWAAFAWSTPVIRFVQNFNDPPTDHTEIWSHVRSTDPIVQRALHAQGRGWIRTFDTGTDESTDQLGGTCFAIERKRLVGSGVCDGWMAWPEGVGGSDRWAGAKLGSGVVVPGTFAYHFGRWSPEKWNAGKTMERIIDTNPSAVIDAVEYMDKWTR